MVFSSSDRLGRYEILAPIGRGGMGEVYRARDERLDREVAIKVLPEEVAQDEARLARFEREAKLLASLNHGSIAALHGLEELELPVTQGEAGSSSPVTPSEAEGRVEEETPRSDQSPEPSGEPSTRAAVPPLAPADLRVETRTVRFLVMELAEGETLAERIEKGPIPVEDALPIALQIAEGLEAAHEQGIIHRDLKPANVMLSPEGKVKILDFGLAKAWAPEESDADLSHSPTLTAQATAAGVLLGTAAYMSPEQARGKPVDRRADVWAFGCVLYECLTGRRAFPGDTISDTLAAILKTDPDWARLPTAAPEALRRLLRRSLARDPWHRLRSIGDARLEIEEAMAEAVRPPAPPPAASHWPAWLVLTVVAVLAILALAVITVGRRARYSEEALVYRPLTHQRGMIRSACLSRDGRTVVYSAAWEGRPLELFLLRLESADARPVALEPHHARVLSISSRGEVAILLPPDPDTVLLPTFRSGTLARIPLTGGTPRAIAEGVHDADWDPSGEQFAVARGVEAGVQLEYPVGEVLHHVAGDINAVRISPSGDLVAFFDHPFANNNRGTVAVADRDGEVRTLSAELENLTGLAWSPDGREIWFSGADEAGDALFAIDLSGHLRVMRRSPDSLVLHGTTPDGVVLLSHYLFRLDIAALAPGETSERDLSWRGASLVTDISDDGREILFLRQDVMEYDVWLRGTDGSPPARLGPGVSLSLSPDGTWALAGVFSRTSPLTLLPTGAGTSRVLEGKSGALFADWTPDGERIVWAAADPTGAARLYVQAIAEGEITTISEEGIQTAVDRPFQVSPDGRWVAASGPDSLVKLYPVEGGRPRDVPGALPGDEPSGWTEDGGALFVSQFERLPAQIFRLDLESGSRSLWRELMPRDPAGIAGVYSLALTPDGQSYAYTYSRYLGSLYVVTGLE